MPSPRSSRPGSKGTGESRTVSTSVRDVIFDEDRHQLRTGNGPEIMAALCNLATRPHPTLPRRQHLHRLNHQIPVTTTQTSHQTTHPTNHLNQLCRPPGCIPCRRYGVVVVSRRVGRWWGRRAGRSGAGPERRACIRPRGRTPRPGPLTGCRPPGRSDPWFCACRSTAQDDPSRTSTPGGCRR